LCLLEITYSPGSVPLLETLTNRGIGARGQRDDLVLPLLHHLGLDDGDPLTPLRTSAVEVSVPGLPGFM
jgi:hypothetical protein